MSKKKNRTQRVDRLNAQILRLATIAQEAGHLTSRALLANMAAAVATIQPIAAPSDRPSEIVVHGLRSLERCAMVQGFGDLLWSSSNDLAQLLIDASDDGLLSEVVSAIASQYAGQSAGQAVPTGHDPEFDGIAPTPADVIKQAIDFYLMTGGDLGTLSSLLRPHVQADPSPVTP